MIGGDSIGFVKEHYKAYEEEKVSINTQNSLGETAYNEINI